MSSSESWVVFISNDKALNYSALDWMPYGNNYCTQTPGASVSLTYEYDIAYVWGSYHPANKLPAVSATQDGQAARILPPNPIPNNTNPNSSLQWLVVFTQDGLKNHTLEIVADGASAATPFCLWRIDVTAPVRQQSNFAEASPVGSNATTSSSSTLSATSTVPSSTSPPSHASSRGPSTGALVGGVIGAVSLTLLICGTLFFWYRRQHKHRYAPTDLDDDVLQVYARALLCGLSSFLESSHNASRPNQGGSKLARQ
ncbi:hypothetical protein L226DRAFT_573785 [Lentinus tigrinus ALCF2SS1-7]|uniref:Mid2 domain-containing protein n=1 Tax=Lentinus tigrinus ALCF2SS1-6 TaxID=1328759 RepID=A0A5C2S074_9APHY|nr:hypothetical protein L227DRAFT_614331 [Lentinus tigrinus ALCF2SS1-6]RPD71587.1 hypothetical protein L226DRAFT_573785 [Lentinus tigrinus ALCF2SS1-7]